MKNRIFKFILVLLGFKAATSCDCEQIFTEPDLYAAPHATYEVKGRVTDSDGNPIQGIQVSVYGLENSTNTDITGLFQINESAFLMGNEATIVFTDTDGPENGGTFRTKTVVEPLQDMQKPDGELVLTTDNLEITLEKEAE